MYPENQQCVCTLDSPSERVWSSFTSDSQALQSNSLEVPSWNGDWKSNRILGTSIPRNATGHCTGVDSSCPYRAGPISR